MRSVHLRATLQADVYESNGPFAIQLNEIKRKSKIYSSINWNDVQFNNKKNLNGWQIVHTDTGARTHVYKSIWLLGLIKSEKAYIGSKQKAFDVEIIIMNECAVNSRLFCVLLCAYVIGCWFFFIFVHRMHGKPLLGTHFLPLIDWQIEWVPFYGQWTIIIVIFFFTKLICFVDIFFLHFWLKNGQSTCHLFILNCKASWCFLYCSICRSVQWTVRYGYTCAYLFVLLNKQTLNYKLTTGQ